MCKSSRSIDQSNFSLRTSRQVDFSLDPASTEKFSARQRKCVPCNDRSMATPRSYGKLRGRGNAAVTCTDQSRSTKLKTGVLGVVGEDGTITLRLILCSKEEEINGRLK